MNFLIIFPIGEFHGVDYDLLIDGWRAEENFKQGNPSWQVTKHKLRQLIRVPQSVSSNLVDCEIYTGMSSAREDLRLVNIHDRDFQKYSVDNRIYCVPVDEVCSRSIANGTFTTY